MLETVAVILLALWLLGLATSTTLGGFIEVLLIAAIVLFLVRFSRGMRKRGSKDRLTLVDQDADFERVDGERLAPDAFRSSAFMRLEKSSGARSEFSETVPALSCRAPETRSRLKPVDGPVSSSPNLQSTRVERAQTAMQQSVPVPGTHRAHQLTEAALVQRREQVFAMSAAGWSQQHIAAEFGCRVHAVRSARLVSAGSHEARMASHKVARASAKTSSEAAAKRAATKAAKRWLVLDLR